MGVFGYLAIAKPRITFARSVFLLVASIWICAPAHSAPNNGDFEQGTTSGWAAFNTDKQPLQWGVTSDRAKVHSGGYAGALTQFGGTNSPLHIVTGNIDVGSWPTGSLCLGTL